MAWLSGAAISGRPRWIDRRRTKVVVESIDTTGLSRRLDYSEGERPQAKRPRNPRYVSQRLPGIVIVVLPRGKGALPGLRCGRRDTLANCR